MVDTDNNVIRAEIDHLTVFDITHSGWEAARLPSMQPFQVSQFTGAATYALDLWTLPGPGGLQPSLNLSYNSQVVDSAAALQTQASWVGMGWSLDTGAIELNQNGTTDYYGDDTYSFSAPGVSSPLLKGADTYFHTADETFWRIKRDQTTDTWVAWDKQGNRYDFGLEVDATNYPARAYFPAMSGCDDLGYPNVTFRTWRWALTKITNIYGKSLVFYNQKQTKDYRYTCQSTGFSRTYTTNAWQYPFKIQYPDSPYSVEFEREGRTDYRSEWEGASKYNFFMNQRLKGVLVKNGAQVVRSYRFNYYSSGAIFPANVWTKGGYTLALQSVQEFAGDYDVTGTPSLPATSFTYDGLHLVSASNGYGGRVDFSYEGLPWHEMRATYTSDPYNQDTDQTHDKTGCSSGTPNLVWSSGAALTCFNTDVVVNGEALLAIPDTYFQPGGYYRVETLVKDYSELYYPILPT